MGDKKNIDRLFQEQFKNFEVTPDNAVWENIQSRLDEENQRNKKVPFWIKMGGVAASLLLLVVIGISLYPKDSIKNEIVDVSENENSTIKNVSNTKKSESVPEIIVDRNTNDPLMNSNTNDLKNDPLGNESNTIRNKQLRNTVVIDSKAVNSDRENMRDNLKFNEATSLENDIMVAGNNTNLILKESSFNKNLNELEGFEVVHNSTLLKQKNMLSRLGVSDEIEKKGIDELADKTSLEKKNIQFSLTNSIGEELTKKNKDEIESINNDKRSSVASNDVINKENISDNNINNVSDIELVENESNNINSENITSPSLEVDVEKNNLKKESDDEEKPVEKSIEEVIAELQNEDDEKKENLEEDSEEDVAFNKWRIAPNIAPVYYNSLSGGSPIDSQLAANKKKGQLTTSYGLGVGYMVNKRLTIRTGLNKVELGYDTQDVAVNASLETVDGPRMKNINLAPGITSLNVVSSNSFSVSQIPSSFSSLFNSSLNQRLGYLEVPLELSYKVSDKNMKIDVIAGVSTFVLNKNEIYTETNGKTTFIGEANNLNKMSYSTNIGLGFNYKITKGFNFNFEPMFKYQLNTFSNDSGGFKPYILGVYSGISYKF